MALDDLRFSKYSHFYNAKIRSDIFEVLTISDTTIMNFTCGNAYENIPLVLFLP